MYVIVCFSQYRTQKAEWIQVLRQQGTMTQPNNQMEGGLLVRKVNAES